MKISSRARELFDRLARGWNTWDVRSVTSHVFLPDGLEINLSVFIPDSSCYKRDFTWDEVKRFGEHAKDGSYSEIELSFSGLEFRVETAADGDELVMKVETLKVWPGAHYALEISPVWGGKLSIEDRHSEIIVRSDSRTFTCRSLQKRLSGIWNPCRTSNLTHEAKDILYFTVNSSKSEEEIDRFLDCSREKWLSSTVTSDGEMEKAVEAMRRSLIWNTIYEPHNKRVITPVTRKWCLSAEHFGDYVLFGWDTFFAALMYGLIDKNLAYANFFSMLQEASPEGMIPNFGAGNGMSRDRSEPQVGSMCAYKLYERFRENWFLEEVFGPLLDWNRWRFRERDRNGDGLLELASVPWEDSNPNDCWKKRSVGEKQGAMWESGLDNSPMWDDAEFDTQSHCMKLSYVGLNALLVADCEFLEEIASILGRESEREELRARRKALTKRINEELWSEERGIYLNKHWDGRFSDSLSATHFYIFLGSIASQTQIKRMIEEHLLNEREFWGEYILPTISRDDPAFHDQYYWRGRIWAPTNFLVYEGLKRIGRSDHAEELALKGLRMFVKLYDEKGYVGENYNALTGEASESGQPSDKFYHWGALLAYMAIETMGIGKK